MVVPVAAANNLVTGFHRALLTSMGMGLVVSAVGVIGSYYWNTASGATIVVSAIVVFMISAPIGSWLTRRRSLRAPDDPIVRTTGGSRPPVRHDAADGGADGGGVPGRTRTRSGDAGDEH